MRWGRTTGAFEHGDVSQRTRGADHGLAVVRDRHRRRRISSIAPRRGRGRHRLGEPRAARHRRWTGQPHRQIRRPGSGEPGRGDDLRHVRARGAFLPRRRRQNPGQNPGLPGGGTRSGFRRFRTCARGPAGLPDGRSARWRQPGRCGTRREDAGRAARRNLEALTARGHKPRLPRPEPGHARRIPRWLASRARALSGPDDRGGPDAGPAPRRPDSVIDPPADRRRPVPGARRRAPRAARLLHANARELRSPSWSPSSWIPSWSPSDPTSRRSPARGSWGP